MTTSRTIRHLQADMHRAKLNGIKSVIVNVEDMAEVLALAEAHVRAEQSKAANRHAGWITADKLVGILNGSKPATTVYRWKPKDQPIELFFAEDVRGMRKAAKAAMENQAAEQMAEQSAEETV